MKPTLTALAFLSLPGVAAAAEKPSVKPNIVLILADDKYDVHEPLNHSAREKPGKHAFYPVIANSVELLPIPWNSGELTTFCYTSPFPTLAKKVLANLW